VCVCVCVRVRVCVCVCVYVLCTSILLFVCTGADSFGSAIVDLWLPIIGTGWAMVHSQVLLPLESCFRVSSGG
jgi:uncharacterized membrane protein YgaE (UPF0421/DUF939 family)